jgi:hypothetical protein
MAPIRNGFPLKFLHYSKYFIQNQMVVSQS